MLGQWGRAQASAYVQGLRGWSAQLRAGVKPLLRVWSTFCSAQHVWTQPVELCSPFGLVFTGSASGVLTPEETLSVY